LVFKESAATGERTNVLPILYCLIKTGLLFPGKELLGLDPRNPFPAMSKNDRINPLAATYTTPIDRADLECSFFQHQSTAPMASVGPTVLDGNNFGHERTLPF
jgi:hypothetical protein